MQELLQNRELIVWGVIWLLCPAAIAFCTAVLRKVNREQKLAVEEDSTYPAGDQVTPEEAFPFPAKEDAFVFPPPTETIKTTFNKPTPQVNRPATAAGAPEMLDRLDTMASRLNEMQTVLNRQASAPTPSTGQGFSPETIDKLIKIIGNVTQQVEVLQKSLSPQRSPETPLSDAQNASPSANTNPTPKSAL